MGTRALQMKLPRIGSQKLAILRHKRRGGARDSLALSGRQVQSAALPAVQEIDYKSDGKPHEKSDPIHDRQTGHQEQAGEDGKYRGERAAGSAKGAVALRFAITKDKNACGDERKGEQSADVGEVGEGADIEKTGWNADDESRDPGGKIGSEIAAMHAAEDFWEKSVARHSKPNAGLSNLEDKQRRDHAHECAD